MSSYMPTGRTSQVEVETGPLQIQTEYAYRPYPRITTTVLNQGQVLHKIEKKLEQPISSPEEQAEAQAFIGKQHLAVVDTIKLNDSNRQIPTIDSLKSADKEISGDSDKDSGGDFDPTASIFERIESVAGVQRVYHLDVEGNFVGRLSDDQFRKEFRKVFKNLQELLSVFALAPGGKKRERGVCEIERDRLYFVSAETECFLVSIRRTDGETVYEKVLKSAIERRKRLRA